VVSTGLLDAAVATGSLARPSTEPGPGGNLLGVTGATRADQATRGGAAAEVIDDMADEAATTPTTSVSLAGLLGGRRTGGQ
jgi:hypothetical protein